MLKNCLVLLVGCVLLFACSGDDGDGGGGGGAVKSGPFRGVITGMTTTGIVAVTISETSARSTDVASATYPVTGTLTIGTTPVTLTGTFDDVTGAFSVSGGGFTLTGTWVNGTISGTFTGPSVSGSFGLLADTNGAVQVYCGTFMKNGVQGSGTWNLVDGAAGTVTGSASSGVTLNGTRSGTTITLTFDGGSATGMVSGTSVTGTWTATDGSGTWEGSTTACGV